MAIARSLARLLVLVLLLGTALAQQGPSKGERQFAAKLQKLHFEQSQRHLEYGLDLRKQGMSAQAAEQIVLASELGNGRNPAATQVLYVMRAYDDAFWKRYGSKATPGKVAAYTKKAKGLLITDQEECLQLATFAATNGLESEAMDLFGALLTATDEPLTTDAKGRIVLAAGTIPEPISRRIRELAITINGREYVRDELLAKLPALAQIFEVTSETLRVRTTTTLEDAQALHTLCSALLPELAKEMGASPTSRLQMFVFATRPEFETTLDALDLGDHKVVSGVATNWPRVAILCAADLDREALHGVCLHELTHLFVYACSRTAFPAWYSEGFADSFGGAGTFRWDGKVLSVGGKLPAERLRPLKAEGGLIPLRDLLQGDQLVHWKRGKEAGLAFYAQSWAFLRYLRTGAGDAVAARFGQWESRCIGQALGYQMGVRRPGEHGPAHALFLELFEKDLPNLEQGFATWLKEQ